MKRKICLGCSLFVCSSSVHQKQVSARLGSAHGMRNELYLRSRTGVSASFLALTCARCQREQFLTPNRGKAELSGWGPRSAVFLPDAFSHMGGSAFGATAHDDVHGAVHDAFMTLPPYTRTSEDEVHSLGLGVRNCSHSALSDPLSEQSERIERACEATSAEGTACCASRGILHSKLSLKTIPQANPRKSGDKAMRAMHQR